MRITSTPANGTHYVVGEAIVTRLDLPAHLFAGNPLASTMKLDIGGVERLATGITPYSFALAGADYTYTVAAGDVDVDGISIPANAIATNGGPWRTSGAAIINLNNAALPNQAAHKVIARAAYISATSPSPLVEASLNGATVTVALDGVSFLNSATTSSFMPVTTVPNVTITNAGSISAGDTSATLTLAQSGNFDADATLAVSVAASALSGASALATNAVPVLPDTPTASISSTSPAALTEANLHQASVTVALANAVFGSGVGVSSFDLATAIPGVSVALASNVSVGDTTATLTLAFTGDFSAVSTLAVKVLAAAHSGSADITSSAVNVTPTPGIVLDPTSLALEEDPTAGGATNANVGTYTVALAANPTTAGGNDCLVNIEVASNNADVTLDTDSTPLTQRLAFAATDWNTPQTVTVTAASDADGVDAAATISHRVVGACSGGFFGRPSLPSLTVAVNDDETPSAAIASPAILAAAALNNATVTVSLSLTTFASGVGASSFELVTGASGVSIASATATAGGTSATLTLSHTGTLGADAKLAVKVLAAAHAGDADLTTAQIDVLLSDTAPSFGGATVPAKYFAAGVAIAPFQLPAATGGNGAIDYAFTSSGLPAGLKFDASGADAGGCTAGDFPPGTAATWATAPRTVCGTPTATAPQRLVVVIAHDADSNRTSGDRSILTFRTTVYGASIASTSPATLTEASLNNATVSLSLAHTTFASGVTAASFELVTAIPGVSVSQVSGAAVNTTTATLTLAFAGDLSASQTLAVRVKAAAHNRASDLTTDAVAVRPQGFTDTAPSFGGATVPAKYFAAGVAIAPFQLPAATGGNGAIDYAFTSSSLPAGLKFDASGADASGCTAGDFPPGTAASWATAPRTVCGTPTATAPQRLVVVIAHDADSNRTSGDRSILTFRTTVYGASIASTSPASLTEASLNNATVSLSLAHTTFASGVTAASFELVTAIPGVSVSQVSGAAVNTTTATLTLAFTGDFSASQTLTVKVKAAAHNRASDLTTGTVAVAATDTEPAFPAIADRSFLPGVAIAPFQIPAAGGNGAVSYAAAGLPAGLKFDATGADAGGCAASDFPPGTAGSWATAPRTVCGTPLRNVASVVVVTATDEDGDAASVMFRVTVAGPAAALANFPAALTEANLDGAALTVTLARTTFESGVSATGFELATDIPGVSIASVVAGATSTTLTLAFAGDFSAVETLAVRVKGSAHSGSANDLTAGTLTVTPTPGIALNPASLTLEEDPAAGGATNANVGAYTVALTADPTTAAGGGCAVVVLATSTAGLAIGADASPQTKLLSFDETNWSTPQTVAVAARHDADGVDTTIAIRHSRAGDPCAGGYFGRPSLAALPVTVNDDETPSAAITSPTLVSTQFGWPIRVDRTVTVTLYGSTFAAGVDASDFELSYSGLDFELSSASATPGAATATLRVSRLTGGLTTSQLGSLAVKVRASAHAGDTDLDTPPISVLFRDTAPSFGSASVPAQHFNRGDAIAPFQIPAASGGNGATVYTAANLPAGLKFDATGADADGCAAADFPPGTAASWATAPRTVCGTPTGTAGGTAVFHARDSDTNRAGSDRRSLSVAVNIVRAALSSTAPLAENGLNGATVDVQLHNAAFGSGVAAASFELLTAIPGLSIASVSGVLGRRRHLDAGLRRRLRRPADPGRADQGRGPQPRLRHRHERAAGRRAAGGGHGAVVPVGRGRRPALRRGRGHRAVPDSAATGGNGAIAYTAPNLLLLPGLKFDATGTDAGGCAAGDFPPGTDASWATAPRTVCGTPTATGAATVRFVAVDADSNLGVLDAGSHRVDINVYGASIAGTNPAPLTEANLNSATTSVRLHGTAFVQNVTAASFELATDIPGLSISALSGAAAGADRAILTLAFAGDFGAPETLAVKVSARRPRPQRRPHHRHGDHRPAGAGGRGAVVRVGDGGGPLRRGRRGHGAVPDSGRQRRQRGHRLRLVGRAGAGPEVRRHRHGPGRLRDDRLPARHRRLLGHRAAHDLRHADGIRQSGRRHPRPRRGREPGGLGPRHAVVHDPGRGRGHIVHPSLAARRSQPGRRLGGA